MKKIISLFIIVMIVSGCSSMLQKNLYTKDVVTEPKSYCQSVKLSLDDIASYDDKECYDFQYKDGRKVTLYISTCESKNLSMGSIWDIGGGPYQIILPNGVSKYDPSHPIGSGACKIQGHIEIPESMCIKKQENNSFWKETKIPVRSVTKQIELIRKRKATEKERKNALAGYQKAFDDNYKKCNNQYNKIITQWKEKTNAKSFCGYIYQEWLNKNCNPPLDRECANLTMPLIQCYQKGLIKLNPEYVKSLI